MSSQKMAQTNICGPVLCSGMETHQPYGWHLQMLGFTLPFIPLPQIILKWVFR